MKIETDENSHFRGVLPREGRWDVEVSASSLPSSPRVRVVVEEGPSGKAEVDISLPSTRAFGTVVDALGVGQVGAVVDFASSTKVEQVKTNEKSQFELLAVQEGAMSLQARLERNGNKWTTERKVIEIREGEDAGPIQLILREGQTVHGRVRSPHGAVAGATVAARGLGRSGGVGSARTDLEGKFSVELPQGLGLLSLLVSAPGYALQAFEVTTEKPIELVLTDRSGTLEIGATDIDGETEILLIFQGNSLLDTGTLTRWAQGNGQPLDGQDGLLIPRLAPASSSVCRVPLGALLQHGPGSTAVEAGSCNSGVLRANETLRLAAPSGEKEGEPL